MIFNDPEKYLELWMVYMHEINIFTNNGKLGGDDGRQGRSRRSIASIGRPTSSLASGRHVRRSTDTPARVSRSFHKNGNFFHWGSDRTTTIDAERVRVASYWLLTACVRR